MHLFLRKVLLRTWSHISLIQEYELRCKFIFCPVKSFNETNLSLINSSSRPALLFNFLGVSLCTGKLRFTIYNILTLIWVAGGMYDFRNFEYV
jgi:hypothetical protein